MELVAGGDLLELVNEARGLPEDEARYLFQQLVGVKERGGGGGGGDAEPVSAAGGVGCGMQRAFQEARVRSRSACLPACTTTLFDRSRPLFRALLPLRPTDSGG